MAENRSFAQLVSLACHDLRTPLATIHGFIRTIERVAKLEPPADRYVEMIDAASVQMQGLLDDLGLVARIEGGRYEPMLTEADTLALAHAAAARVGAERVGVTGSGRTVSVDADAAERALAALLTCALRHGGLERVEVGVREAELAIAPVSADVRPIVLGENLRDLGAAVAVRLVEALGGSVAADAETVSVRLPTAANGAAAAG